MRECGGQDKRDGDVGDLSDDARVQCGQESLEVCV